MPPQPVAIEASAPVWDKASLIELATSETKKEHVNTKHFIDTMSCEVMKDDAGNWVADGQSQFKDKTGPNGKEPSFGPMMIDLYYHPEVSREQATDPTFAIPWAVHQFATGHASMWTCWRHLYGKTP